MIYSPYFWISLVCLLGLIFFTAAIIMRTIMKKKQACYTGKIEGTVVENKLIRERDIGINESSPSSMMYYAIVSYNVNGKTCTYKSNIHGAKPLHKVGDIVTVCYNPKKPEEFFIKEEQYIAKRIQYIFGTIGIGLLIVGVAAGICIKIYFS